MTESKEKIASGELKAKSYYDFANEDEYQKLLDSCSTVIKTHITAVPYNRRLNGDAENVRKYRVFCVSFEDRRNDDGGRSAANGRNHKDIRQRFPVANKNVTFWLNKGEILALVGENGAGKDHSDEGTVWSLENPQSGQVFMDGGAGEDLQIRWMRSVKESEWFISTSCCCHPLTVAENVVLGIEPMKNGFLTSKKLLR